MTDAYLFGPLAMLDVPLGDGAVLDAFRDPDALRVIVLLGTPWGLYYLSDPSALPPVVAAAGLPTPTDLSALTLDPDADPGAWADDLIRTLLTQAQAGQRGAHVLAAWQCYAIESRPLWRLLVGMYEGAEGAAQFAVDCVALAITPVGETLAARLSDAQAQIAAGGA